MAEITSTRWQRWRRLTASIGFMAVVGFAVAACAGPSGESADGQDSVVDTWDEAALIAAAEEEGTLTFYSAIPTGNESLIAAFEEKYPGIQVEFLRAPSGELSQKIEAEMQSGADGADVVISTDFAWHESHIESGNFDKILSPSMELPEYQDVAIADTSVRIIGLRFGVAWNTDMVPEGLDSYEDLLDPKLKGRVGAVEWSGSVATIVDYHVLEKELGIEFIERLGQQEPRYYPSVQPLIQAVASGEIWAAAKAVSSSVKSIEGPVGFALVEPSMGNVSVLSIIKSAGSPAAAQLFADFAMSEEGQAAFAEHESSVLSDVPGTIGTLAELTYEINPAEFTRDELSEMADRYNEALGR